MLLEAFLSEITNNLDKALRYVYNAGQHTVFTDKINSFSE